jgi:hypothetical protein
MIAGASLLSALVACGSSRRGDTSTDPPPQQFGDAPPPTTQACQEAIDKQSSVGCDYLAVHMDGTWSADNGCFVVFVANTANQPVHVDVSFAGKPVDLAAHAKIPKGAGRDLAYDDFSPTSGIAPGDVAILFLAGVPDPSPPKTSVNMNDPVSCPVAPAFSSLTQIHGTGRGQAFRIKTDLPVVAYQMLPYGGGNAAVTGATLLLPTSSWGTNYLAVNAYGTGTMLGNQKTSMNIVAAQDDTHVTIRPRAPIGVGADVESAAADEPKTYVLAANEHLQITQNEELTGSPIQADKPIGVFAGMPCMNVPVAMPYCDHGEQQIPPITALGHEYAGVLYRQRTSKAEKPPWRIIGAVDGTKLTWSQPVGGPSTIGQGEVVEFSTGTPFTVKSQDPDHPFLLLSYMSGANAVMSTPDDGYGDADFVRSVPVAQYMDRYVFFTDPTYPETNLVVVRRKTDGKFADVTLDCAGKLSGWTALSSELEYTRIDLSRHDFKGQNGCDNGRHEMKSEAPFGLWVWGWGTTETKSFTGYVSYGYPAGQNVTKLSNVVVPVAR